MKDWSYQSKLSESHFVFVTIFLKDSNLQKQFCEGEEQYPLDRNFFFLGHRHWVEQERSLPNLRETHDFESLKVLESEGNLNTQKTQQYLGLIIPTRMNHTKSERTMLTELS